MKTAFMTVTEQNLSDQNKFSQLNRSHLKLSMEGMCPIDSACNLIIQQQLPGI